MIPSSDLPVKLHIAIARRDRGVKENSDEGQHIALAKSPMMRVIAVERHGPDRQVIVGDRHWPAHLLQ
jgi:hypothetical protein